MKTCWDEIENIFYKSGRFYKNKYEMFLKNCITCNEEFFSSYDLGRYCGFCRNKGKNNPMWGLKRPDITGDKNHNKKESYRKKQSERMKINNPSHLVEVKKKLRKRFSGKNNI